MATLAKAVTYLNAPKGSDITYEQFAFGLGVQGRITLEESAGWHKLYLKESPEAQKEWAYDWRVNYLMGFLQVSSSEADRILSQPRTERKPAHQKAYMRANSQFGYHIVRAEKSGVSKQVKVTVDKVVELFEQLSKAEQAKFMRIVK
jgi:hypothetical protein